MLLLESIPDPIIGDCVDTIFLIHLLHNCSCGSYFPIHNLSLTYDVLIFRSDCGDFVSVGVNRGSDLYFNILHKSFQ